MLKVFAGLNLKYIIAFTQKEFEDIFVSHTCKYAPGVELGFSKRPICHFWTLGLRLSDPQLCARIWGQVWLENTNRQMISNVSRIV